MLNTDSSGTDPGNANMCNRRLCPHGPQAYRLRRRQLYSEDGTHARVQGQNTQMTESYSDGMVDAIHQGFAEFAAAVTATSMRPATPAPQLSQQPPTLPRNSKERIQKGKDTEEASHAQAPHTAPQHVVAEAQGQKEQKERDDESSTSTTQRRCSYLETDEYGQYQRSVFFDETHSAEASGSSSAAGPGVTSGNGGLCRGWGKAFASKQRQLTTADTWWRPQLQLSGGARSP